MLYIVCAHWLVKSCVSDVLQHSANRLGQAAQASPGILFHHAGYPCRVNQDHPVQKPSCRCLLWMANRSSHCCLSGNTFRQTHAFWLVSCVTQEFVVVVQQSSLQQSHCQTAPPPKKKIILSLLTTQCNSGKGLNDVLWQPPSQPWGILHWSPQFLFWIYLRWDESWNVLKLN